MVYIYITGQSAEAEIRVDGVVRHSHMPGGFGEEKGHRRRVFLKTGQKLSVYARVNPKAAREHDKARVQAIVNWRGVLATNIELMAASCEQ